MVEHQDAAGEPERVIPPEPAGAPSTSAARAPSVPLAPPLGPPSPPSGAPLPPHAPLPPYAGPVPYPQQAASPQTTAYAQPGYPQQPAPGAYPLSSVAPPPTSSGSRNVALIVSLVAVGVVLTLAVLGIVLGFTIGSGSGAAPAPAPSWSVPDATTAPSEEQPSDDAPDDEIDDGTATDPTGIADVLEAKIDEYKRLRESGELWQTIPDTEYNRTAVSAFLFFLTDMKVATIWGINEQTAAEYEERMAMLEERLLAQEPLGDDVKITFEDGRVFTYDGETGEGGYTEG